MSADESAAAVGTARATGEPRSHDRREPYVGEGADGARRSALIDRDELDTLAADDPRRPVILASIEQWERQARGEPS